MQMRFCFLDRADETASGWCSLECMQTNRRASCGDKHSIFDMLPFLCFFAVLFKAVAHIGVHAEEVPVGDIKRYC